MLIFCILLSIAVLSAHFHWKAVERMTWLTPIEYTNPQAETMLVEKWYHMLLRFCMIMRPRYTIWYAELDLKYFYPELKDGMFFTRKLEIYYSPTTKKFSIPQIKDHGTYMETWTRVLKYFEQFREDRELVLRTIRIMAGNYEHYLDKESEFLYRVKSNVIYSPEPLNSHDVQT